MAIAMTSDYGRNALALRGSAPVGKTNGHPMPYYFPYPGLLGPTWGPCLALLSWLVMPLTQMGDCSLFPYPDPDVPWDSLEGGVSDLKSSTPSQANIC